MPSKKKYSSKHNGNGDTKGCKQLEPERMLTFGNYEVSQLFFIRSMFETVPLFT